jgi:hypothetical protein
LIEPSRNKIEKEGKEGRNQSREERREIRRIEREIRLESKERRIIIGISNKTINKLRRPTIKNIFTGITIIHYIFLTNLT